MNMFNKKIWVLIAGISLILLLAAIVVHLRSPAAKPESLALYFVKHVYSDFRSDRDNKEFERNVKMYVAAESHDFRKLLLDKKLIKERDDRYFSSKESLRKAVYKKPEVLSEDNGIILKIKAEYDYDEFYVTKNGHEKKLSSSGEVADYIVHLIRSNGWKIQDIHSNDLTSGIMFPEVLTQDVSKKSAYEDFFGSKSKQKTYDLKRILRKRKKLGQETVKEMEKKFHGTG